MYYIGLMSGTSMDGIDVALASLEPNHRRLIHSASYPYAPSLRKELQALCQPGPDEINRLGGADRQVAQAFAQATKDFLKTHQLEVRQIAAIGSHGQTIRHWPQGPHGFSLQIGDGNTIACETGIPVVADFRKKDIALGGQGAPLVPAFHRDVFYSPTQRRAVVNIGGIANITTLLPDEKVRGWDTGPGNTLMDHWCRRHLNQAYDESGQWAASGCIQNELLQSLLSDPYFSAQPPKSTGPEYFNLSWLQTHLHKLTRSLSAEDIQATLCELTIQSISQDLKQIKGLEQVFICGGGAHNRHLLQGLAQTLPHLQLQTTSELGIDADGVEAMAFAWLAWAFQEKMNGNIPSVTGARRPAILGSLFLP